MPDTCSGDSGGGLIAERFDGNRVLLGVVSFGESDCGLRGGRPGVYTNVLSHASWIRNIVDGGSTRRCRTEDGRVCQFPFSYEGKRYTRCTTDKDPDGRLWCSTKVDKNNNHVQNEGQWGYCSDQCKSTRLQDLTTGNLKHLLVGENSSLSIIDNLLEDPRTDILSSMKT